MCIIYLHSQFSCRFSSICLFSLKFKVICWITLNPRYESEQTNNILFYQKNKQHTELFILSCKYTYIYDTFMCFNFGVSCPRQVSSAVEDVKKGTDAFHQTRKMKHQTYKWMWMAILVFILVAIVTVIVVLKPWKHL